MNEIGKSKLVVFLSFMINVSKIKCILFLLNAYYTSVLCARKKNNYAKKNIKKFNGILSTIYIVQKHCLITIFNVFSLEFRGYFHFFFYY